MEFFQHSKDGMDDVKLYGEILAFSLYVQLFFKQLCN